MKQFAVTLSLLASVAVSPVWAEEFYVELGRAPSEAEAKAIWEQLQPKHKVLADYDVFPNQILEPGRQVSYRVQAGPMLDKKEAQNVCRRLFRKNVSCFVIEGFDPKNAKTFEGDAAIVNAPVMVNAQDFVLPWLRADRSQEIKQPLVDSKGKGKVDVAEAIPVPVTEDNQVTIGETVAISTEADSASAAVNIPGWLNVQPFLDKERAQKFWEELKNLAPDSAKKLSMRMVRPLVSHDIPKVVVSIGTFESEQAALKFCHDYIPKSNILECQFSAQPPEGDEGAASSSKVAADEYSLYWVEVLSERSQDRALEKWERIRTDNDDILSNIRSQITASLARPGVYVVRIGPLKAKGKATALCDALKARGTECSIASL